ncbi:hypothetical protein WJV46_003844 [Escherichia coli]
MSESKCQINGNKIEPCAALAQSLEHDAEYTTRKGLLKYKIYNGYEIKTITHPHFGDKPVKVYAIKVNING